MTDLFFDTAFLPSGWADDVRISVDAKGWITRVDADTTPGDASRVAGIALPGVPDVHSHAFQRALLGLTQRGSPSGDSFWSWRERMYQFLRSLDPESVQAIAAQLFVELIRNGFTSLVEFHYLRNDTDGRPYDDPVEMGRRLLSAAEHTGLGLTLLPTLYRASDFGAEPPTRQQRRFVATVEELVGDVAILGAGATPGTVRIGLALHSLRAVPPEALRSAVDAVRSMDPEIPVHIHVAEQEREVEACLAWSGARPVAWLLDNAPVDRRWCLVHATHTEREELEAIARHEATVALCPSTEADLGDGVFPLARFGEVGGSWAIGTDSHVGRDPAEELRLLEYGQRLTSRTRNVAAGLSHRSTGRALLEEAWAGGATACGRSVGGIAPRLRADLIVLDGEHPSLAGRSGDEILDAWIFSGDRTPVRDVMVGGRWLVQDGRHEAEDDVAGTYRAVARAHSLDKPQLTMDLPE